MIVNLYTPTEVAERLNIKPITVIRLFDAGALQGVVIRAGAKKRTIRFRPETVEKFIVAREQKQGRSNDAGRGDAHSK